MNESTKFVEYTIPREDISYCVEFCNSETSSQLLAVGTESKVSIYQLKFKEEDEDVEDFEFQQLTDFQNGCRVTAMSWSPDTSLFSLPKVIRLAVAGSDRRIRIFSTDLKGDGTVQLLEGHTDFVNSVTFDPDSGTQLASTGDDRWCRIWGQDGNQQLAFPLGSPGMTVCWHRDEPMKVMVALKTGTIKIFSLTGQQQLMSFETGSVPLMEADWSLGNKGLLIGAVTIQEWVMFDVSVSSQPVERRQIHVEGCRHFRWARCHDSLAATVGRPGRQIKVFNTKTQQTPLTISQPIAYTISWHQKLPVLAAGGDQKVHIYMIESI
ncbi:nucleoporin Nup37-like [Dreissena polymorpha]|uniref:nucleoporin Nup37-like n=1 Tax=Dreissena polymorpha TaxID=45954 RepID=UPI0022656C83|nr:nucleoporin Nup37-like [Dreissena polymorpha]